MVEDLVEVGVIALVSREGKGLHVQIRVLMCRIISERVQIV